MDKYRRLRVDIYPGKTSTTLAVVAQTVQGGARRDALLLRATVDLADTDTVAACLRLVADECHGAADRLM